MAEPRVMTEPPAAPSAETMAPESRSPTAGEDANVHASGLAIIASKIEPASPARSILLRPRLVGWLEQQREARLVLVSAEAGYGKSTLLNDFALHTPDRCVWYRMESSDGDWITFLSYLVAAFREVSPGFGRSTEALLRHVAAMGSSREVVLAQFLADLGSIAVGRVAVILDDYHAVEESADVRLILSRMLERAPEGMYVILGGRGRPNLSLGRLLAQGRVSELTIDDLRFTRTEIHELFSTTYGQPLDEKASRIVAERTEGWAASLRLVSASIAVSRPGEIAAFIDALSGAEGPIYDFLAEEVLARLSAQTERILVHASLLDRVRPELVVAALSVAPDPPGPDAVEHALSDARALGLLGDRGDSGGGRIHPLFREFLAVHLEREVTEERLHAMHNAIAAAAEPDDWLVAGKHYALADEPDEAMRVLGSGASEALGTGAWGAAVEIIDLMPDASPPPAVQVIQARALVSDGFPEEALSLLQTMSADLLESDDRALVSLARASALQTGGHGEELWGEVATLRSTHHSNPVVNRLAEAWSLIGVAFRGGSIGAARQSLGQLADASRTQGLRHFEGIALHNAATAALAEADYKSAVRLSKDAQTAFQGSPPDASVTPSAVMVEGLAMAEMGSLSEAKALVDRALGDARAHPDVVADAAWLAAICGDERRSALLQHRLQRAIASGPTQVGTPLHLAVVRVTRLVAQGNLTEARTAASHLRTASSHDLDGPARAEYLTSLVSVLIGAPTASDDVAAAHAASMSQQAWRWDYRVRLVDAVFQQDRGALLQWLAECDEASQLAVLETADLLGTRLELLEPIPRSLSRSIALHPDRWRPVLRRQLTNDGQPGARVAALLLAEHGGQEDASPLAAYERRVSTGGRRIQLSRTLARRISPTLRIHDLGRTTYEVSGVEVHSSSARRKALALLLFLVTRPKQTATRESLMEGLWPNQAPDSAVNSLHQTLHFVRRDIAPSTPDGIAAEYVPLDAELIYLDPELVQVDSVAFMRQATEALASPNLVRVGPAIASLYTGRFAPEFEYEDWAEDWRTLLHAQFLLLTQASATALLAANRTQQAIEVLSRAIEIDGLAFDLRAMLVRALSQAGAVDAAGDHYRHLVNLMRRELDERPPPLSELLRTQSEDEVL